MPDKITDVVICEQLMTQEQLNLHKLLSIIDEDGPGRIRLKDMKHHQQSEYDLWHWVRKRISYTWNSWLAARHSMNMSHSNRKRQRVSRLVNISFFNILFKSYKSYYIVFYILVVIGLFVFFMFVSLFV